MRNGQEVLSAVLADMHLMTGAARILAEEGRADEVPRMLEQIEKDANLARRFLDGDEETPKEPKKRRRRKNPVQAELPMNPPES